jgi:hypothetical protein
MNTENLLPVQSYLDLERQFIKELTETDAFKRIQKVSFLGVVDYYNLHNSKSNTQGFSRADHSWGVLALAQKLIGHLNLEYSDRLHVIAAAVCHDLGHSPFSHSVEKVYTKINPNIDHKIALYYLLDRKEYGVYDVLFKFDIAPERIFSISSSKDDPLSWIFHNPINIDTLDGIGRFLLSFKLISPFDINGAIESLALLWMNRHELQRDRVRNLDIFWELKAAFYDHFLRRGRYARVEEAFIELIFAKKRNVNMADYLKDDTEFVEEMGIAADGWEVDSVAHEDRVSIRSAFEIDKRIKLQSIDDLYRRYKRRRKL